MHRGRRSTPGTGRESGHRHSGGTVTVVSEPTARGGARAVFTPAATGDHPEYRLAVPVAPCGSPLADTPCSSPWPAVAGASHWTS
ncbi:hypothetical protein ACWDRB_32320 [Nonomuraea sp. NPDC003707]